MESPWYTGQVSIPTYELTELLGTKLRALYQRRKGRDLFDMWHAMIKTDVDPARIIRAWQFYMEREGNTISRQEFLDNMEKKLIDTDFRSDMEGLLRPGVSYPIADAYEFVKGVLLEKI